MGFSTRRFPATRLELSAMPGSRSRHCNAVNVALDAWRQKHRSDHADRRHKHIHMRRRMKDTMPESEQKAQWGQRRSRVIPQVFRIAEDESGLMLVIRVP